MHEPVVRADVMSYDSLSESESGVAVSAGTGVHVSAESGANRGSNRELSVDLDELLANMDDPENLWFFKLLSRC